MTKKNRSSHSTRGFTLLEVLIAVRRSHTRWRIALQGAGLMVLLAVPIGAAKAGPDFPREFYGGLYDHWHPHALSAAVGVEKMTFIVATRLGDSWGGAKPDMREIISLPAPVPEKVGKSY